ncbi:MAG TPA: RNA polymerase sigma factor SigJ [Candidatus Eisenbacteria bacterium]
MESRDRLAERFEECRPYLRAVAYRMLGSPSEAEDAVQECWLRLDRADASAIEDLRRWLTVVVSRICLDVLRARRVQLLEYAGTWIPEPQVALAPADGPEHEASIADSVGLALLVVLETLAPAERLAFVLHDVFALPFEEIAAIMGRTPASARQLASRARRRIRSSDPRPETDRKAQRRVVEAFLAAARAGDFEGLLAVLDPDVVMRTDGGGQGPLARAPIVGARRVAAFIRDHAAPFAPMGRPALVNGSMGVLVGPPEKPVAVTGMTIVDGRIVAIDLLGDPAKLGRLRLQG